MARARLSIDKWRRLIEEYERSGESQAAFVGRKGLRMTTFQKKLYEIRREGTATSAAFVEVSTSADDVIVVEHGDVRLRFNSGVAATRVAEVVSALRRC